MKRLLSIAWIFLFVGCGGSDEVNSGIKVLDKAYGPETNWGDVDAGALKAEHKYIDQWSGLLYQELASEELFKKVELVPSLMKTAKLVKTDISLVKGMDRLPLCDLFVEKTIGGFYPKRKLGAADDIGADYIKFSQKLIVTGYENSLMRSDGLILQEFAEVVAKWAKGLSSEQIDEITSFVIKRIDLDSEAEKITSDQQIEFVSGFINGIMKGIAQDGVGGADNEKSIKNLMVSSIKFSKAVGVEKLTSALGKNVVSAISDKGLLDAVLSGAVSVGLEEGDGVESILSGIIKGVAANDPDKLLGVLTSLEENKESGGYDKAALDQILEDLKASNPELAADLDEAILALDEALGLGGGDAGDDSGSGGTSGSGSSDGGGSGSSSDGGDSGSSTGEVEVIPDVITALPVDSAVDVDPAADLVLTLLHDLDELSLSRHAFSLKETNGFRYFDLEVSYDSSTKKITLDPYMVLDPDETYTLTVYRYITGTTDPGFTMSSGSETIDADFAITFKTMDNMTGSIGFSTSETNPLVQGKCANTATSMEFTIDSASSGISIVDDDCSDGIWQVNVDLSAMAAGDHTFKSKATAGSLISEDTINLHKCASVTAFGDIVASTEFSSGAASSADDPGMIESVEDLKYALGTGNYFKLANDLDFQCIEWESSGFAKTIDGDGYLIRNYTQDLAGSNQGFFSSASTNTLRNIGFVNARMFGSGVKSGVVYANSTGTTTLQGVFVTGQIDNTNTTDYAVSGVSGISTSTQKFYGLATEIHINSVARYTAGISANMSSTNDTLVYVHSGGSIVSTKDYTGGVSTGNFRGYNHGFQSNSAHISGQDHVGGLFANAEGYISTHTVYRWGYNRGHITGDQSVGGLWGSKVSGVWMRTMLLQNTGDISGTTKVGGIIGDGGSEYIRILGASNTGDVSATTIASGIGYISSSYPRNTALIYQKGDVSGSTAYAMTAQGYLKGGYFLSAADGGCDDCTVSGGTAVASLDDMTKDDLIGFKGNPAFRENEDGEIELDVPEFCLGGYFDVVADSSYNSSGSGPFEIDSLEKFIGMASYPSADYVLTQDLDFRRIRFGKPQCLNLSAIDIDLSGTFDGDGYSLNGVSDQLFDDVDGTIKDIDITFLSPTDSDGVLVNTLLDGGIVDGVTFSGSFSRGLIYNVSDSSTSEVKNIQGSNIISLNDGLLVKDLRASAVDVQLSDALIISTEDYGRVGAICGYCQAATITRAQVSNITSIKTDTTGNSGVLSGYLNSTSQVEDSFAQGVAIDGYNATDDAGLISGVVVSSTILTSYFSGWVIDGTSETPIQESNGRKSGTNTITDVYYLDEAADTGGTADTLGVTGFPDAQMQDQTTYSGFDFDTIWELTSQYPTLQ